MNPQKGRQRNKKENYYKNVVPIRIAQNKAKRAKRAARHVAARGHKPHRSNNSPAAKEKQMRRKARNKHEKAKLEYESGMNGHLISITLVQPEQE